jgi:hypothetical protein
MADDTKTRPPYTHSGGKIIRPGTLTSLERARKRGAREIDPADHLGQTPRLMADNPTTVDEAKADVIHHRHDGYQHGEDAGFEARVDALIAAVRAENPPRVGSELDNLKRILKAKRQSDLS